jgi:hypothetical protein
MNEALPAFSCTDSFLGHDSCDFNTVPVFRLSLVSASVGISLATYCGPDWQVRLVIMTDKLQRGPPSLREAGSATVLAVTGCVGLTRFISSVQLPCKPSFLFPFLSLAASTEDPQGGERTMAHCRAHPGCEDTFQTLFLELRLFLPSVVFFLANHGLVHGRGGSMSIALARI